MTRSWERDLGQAHFGSSLGTLIRIIEENIALSIRPQLREQLSPKSPPHTLSPLLIHEACSQWEKITTHRKAEGVGGESCWDFWNPEATLAPVCAIPGVHRSLSYLSSLNWFLSISTWWKLLA